MARSSDYRTPPWGVTDQPPFINAVDCGGDDAVAARTAGARATTANARSAATAPRERRWGPRPIDLDILAYDDVELDDPDLTLPHPHLFERAFVLVPLAEIAPDRVIAGIRVRDALARVDASGIEKAGTPLMIVSTTTRQFARAGTVGRCRPIMAFWSDGRA